MDHKELQINFLTSCSNQSLNYTLHKFTNHKQLNLYLFIYLKNCKQVIQEIEKKKKKKKSSLL